MEGNVFNSFYFEDGKLRCEGNLVIIIGFLLIVRVVRLFWGFLRYWDSSIMYLVKGVNGYIIFFVKIFR